MLRCRSASGNAAQRLVVDPQPLRRSSSPAHPIRGAAALPERLDAGVAPHEAERALRDLRRVYRLLGGRDLQRALLRALATDTPGSRPRSWVLDLGSGGGHVGDDLARRAGRRGIAARVIGVDAKLTHLLAGRRMGSLQLPVVADAAALPVRTGALAVAFSHLFFHHFDAAENRRVLGEMRRVARVVVVVDLARGWLARAAVRPLLRLLRLSPLAFEDGVTSVERAYTLGEVEQVVAGMAVGRLAPSFPARWLLVLRGDD
jgi:SAM-dependent methyltransferase